VNFRLLNIVRYYN